MRGRRRRRRRAVAAVSGSEIAARLRHAADRAERARAAARDRDRRDQHRREQDHRQEQADRRRAQERDILFSLLHDKIDRAVLAANPKLRAVTSMSITPDNIDVAEATRRGIPVTVVPPIVAEATADIHFGLMIAVARRMIEGDRMVRAGKFPGSQSNHLAGSFVHGKTIGLVGRRPHRPGHRAARARLRHANHLLGPAPQARGRAGARHRARLARPAAGGSRFRLAASAAQRRDASHDLRRAVRA